MSISACLPSVPPTLAEKKFGRRHEKIAENRGVFTVLIVTVMTNFISYQGCRGPPLEGGAKGGPFSNGPPLSSRRPPLVVPLAGPAAPLDQILRAEGAHLRKCSRNVEKIWARSYLWWLGPPSRKKCALPEF